MFETGLDMVLGNFYRNVYYYSFENGDMMFLLFSLLKSRCSGLEVLPPLSHCAAFLSVFHKVVDFTCLALVVVWVVVELQICLNMV